MNFSIRRPEQGDLPRLRVFLEMTMKHSFEINGIVGAEAELLTAIQSKYEDMLEDVQSEGKKQFHLLALQANVIVGCMGYGPPNEIIRKHMGISVEQQVELKSAYILPSCQRRGIGLALLQAIVRQLKRKGWREMYLDCGYRLSQPFWQKEFGEASTILHNHWGPDEHHMIWKVTL